MARRKIDMSIDEMIQVSNYLLLFSVLFAVIAAVMFFAYDIVRCFKSIRHGYSITKKQMNTMSPVNVKKDNSKTEKIKTQEFITEKLPDGNTLTQKLETKVIMDTDIQRHI
jgi:Sec-independent protein translocase protein TatA